MKIKYWAVILFAAMAFSACDDNTESIGTFITEGSDRLNVSADTFDISANSLIADSVLSRSHTAYLGCMKDPDTGASVTADFMTQFGILEGYKFPDESNIVSKIGDEVVADSCEIQFYCDEVVGDSLAAMKLTVYEMNSPLNEGVNYYSNYDPFEDGKIRTDGIKINKMYAMAGQKRVGSSSRRSATLKLNQPYTDKNGVTYNNFGTYILRTYYQHPEYFKNSYSFINNVVPGFYIKHTGGIGSMAYIGSTLLNISIRHKVNDSIYNGTLSFAGTEEVLQTTRVSNDGDIIRQLAADNSCTYIKTPAGIFTQLTLPVDDIYRNHETESINSAKVVLPRINNDYQNTNSWSVPKTLLMIPADSIYSFFEKGKIADYKYSFLADYTKTNSTYSDANTYTFNNIGTLISFMKTQKDEGVGQDSDWLLKHPNWNKVVIIPVTATYNVYNNTSRLYKIVHDMSLSTTKLMNDNLKVYVIYSKFQ